MIETQFGIETHTINGNILNEYEEGFDVQGHAKQLCVNKMGHTMVPPPEGDIYFALGSSNGYSFLFQMGRDRENSVLSSYGID